MLPKQFPIILPSIGALTAVLFFVLLGGSIPENLERVWLDNVLRIRAAEYRTENADGNVKIANRARGFAEPLDERIRFVEIEMDQATVTAFAREGEFEVMADLLRRLAKLQPRIVVLDILYSVGREADQRRLFDCIRQIEATGITKVVVPAEIRHDNRMVYSLPTVGGESLRFGFANMEVDEDRIWRRYRWSRRVDGKPIPSLAAAVAQASSSKLSEMPWYLNLQHSYFNDFVDEQAGLGRRVWTRQSIEELSESDVESSPLQDAVVFVGFGAELDGKPTAHGPLEPGMLLHATALNDHWHGKGLYRTDRWTDILFYLSAAVVSSTLFRWIEGKVGLIASGFIGCFLALLGSAVLICRFYVIPPVIGVLLVWNSAYIGELIRRWAMEQSVRLQRDAMLGFYFTPAVLKQVTRDVEMIRPRSGKLAALLSDMRGFTTACEELSPDEIFILLNRLFEIETAAALRENGSLRPFAGDQFLAYWGAPEVCSDAADRALRSAREIVQALRERREAPNADPLDRRLNIGIGLHFGPAVVGHIGSERYRDYNVMGDLINTAARVESQTKYYNAPILATEEFVREVGLPIQAVQLDHVLVKGRSMPVKFFAIDLDPDNRHGDLTQAFEAAYADYKVGRFSSARAKFVRLGSRDEIPTLQTTSRLLGERCERLSAAPPLAWEGIFELTSK